MQFNNNENEKVVQKRRVVKEIRVVFKFSCSLGAIE